MDWGGFLLCGTAFVFRRKISLPVGIIAVTGSTKGTPPCMQAKPGRAVIPSASSTHYWVIALITSETWWGEIGSENSVHVIGMRNNPERSERSEESGLVPGYLNKESVADGSLSRPVWVTSSHHCCAKPMPLS